MQVVIGPNNNNYKAIKSLPANNQENNFDQYVCDFENEKFHKTG